MRAKLAGKTANDNHIPYWSVNEGFSNRSVKVQNLLERSLQKVNLFGLPI